MTLTVRTSKILLKRLALIPLGLLLGLLVLEGALQIAAWWVQGAARSGLSRPGPGADVRMVCIGDSNTYGLYLPRDEAYPQQFDQIWKERVGEPKLEVLNLGFPGTNSSRLVRDLPRLLETLEPQILILMAGVNDFWTVPFPIDDAAAERSLWDRLRHSSLIYRAIYMLRRGSEAPDFEISLDPKANLDRGAHKLRVGGTEFDMGFTRASEELAGDSESLVRNLRLLIDQANDYGVRLYMMNYPSNGKFYKLANRLIREVAAEKQVPFIDLTAIFRRRCPDRRCHSLLFDDGHPKAAGHRIIAETLVERISEDTAGG